MTTDLLVDVVDSRAQADALARPPLLVRDSVTHLLDRAGLGSGLLRETRIGDGHSNITYLIERDGWRGVLRRPPRPPYQAKAHDMVRESTIQQALAGSVVPVPRILLVDSSGDALGVPFYVMEHLDGEVITAAAPVALDHPGGHRQIGQAFVSTLALLHAQDPDALGLASMGRPEGFADRQLATFGRLWDSHRTREIPAVDEAGRWLRAHVPGPSGPPTLVHGDFRIGNVMWAPGTQVTVQAVLDWELATTGEPLSDLGYLLSTYPDGPRDQGSLLSLAGAVAHGSFPSRHDLVEQYADGTDRDLAALDWWVVLAFWRTAVGLESFYRRALSGSTDDPFLLELRTGVPELAHQALAAIAGEWT